MHSAWWGVAHCAGSTVGDVCVAGSVCNMLFSPSAVAVYHYYVCMYVCIYVCMYVCMILGVFGVYVWVIGVF